MRTVSKCIGLLVLTIFFITACAQAEPTPAPATDPIEPVEPVEPDAFDWRRHEGDTIRVVLWTHPQMDYYQPILKEFTDLTGIEVIWEIVPTYADSYSTYLLELTTSPDKIDIYGTVPPMNGYKFCKEGFQEDLRPYLEDSSKTSPDYNPDDFFLGVMDSLTCPNGRLGGIPFYVHTELLAYRCSLYEQYNLEVPKTLEELKANAAILHDPENEMYGHLARGVGPQAVWPFTSYLWNYGGEYVDENFNPTINTPEAVAAFTIYGELLGRYGPPGPTTLDDGEAIAIFKAGKAAHHIAFAPYFVTYSDEDSLVKDDLCFAFHPAGPSGNSPISMGTGFSISYRSQVKDAAWYFIQWATSTEMLKNTHQAGSLSPRTSTWQDPSVKADVETKVPGWSDVAQESLSIGRGDCLPPGELVAPARDIVGTVITVAIQGGDVQTAADKANEEYKRLLEASD